MLLLAALRLCLCDLKGQGKSLWAIRHVGRPSWVSLHSSHEHLYFVSDKFYGALFKATGQIAYRTDLPEGAVLGKLVSNNKVSEEGFLLYFNKVLGFVQLASVEHFALRVDFPQLTSEQLVPEFLYFQQNKHLKYLVFESGLYTFDQNSQAASFTKRGNSTQPILNLSTARSMPKVVWEYEHQRLKISPDNRITYSLKGQKLWERDQELAYSVLYVASELEAGQDSQQLEEYEQLVKQSLERGQSDNPVQAMQLLMGRLKLQFSSVLFWFEELLRVDRPNPQHQRRQALRKEIWAVTAGSWLFKIDSKSGQIIGREQLPPAQYIALVEYRKMNFIFWQQGSQVAVGQLSSAGKVANISRQVMGDSHPKIHKFHESVSLLSKQHWIFDLEARVFKRAEGLFSLDWDQRGVRGFSSANGIRQRIWQVRLPSGFKLIKVELPQRNYKDVKLQLYSDHGVYFKHVDGSKFTVLGINQEENSLVLMVINGATGEILLNLLQREAQTRMPISIATIENQVVVAYFSRSKLGYELWVVEAFAAGFQRSVLGMWDKYLHNESAVDVAPQTRRNSIIFREQKYGINLGVRKLIFTQSKTGLVNKHLLVVTSENRVYKLDHRMFSTRRPDPKKPDSKLYELPQVPPYEYTINSIDTAYVSKEHILAQTTKVHIFHSEFQSTSHYLFAGPDLFFVRLVPDGPFDRLPDDFNYLMVLAIIGGLIVLYYVSLVLWRRARKSIPFTI